MTIRHSARGLMARIKGVFVRQAADRELSEEMQAHLEMEIEDNILRGMNPVEARRRAMLSSGGITQAADAVRDQRGLPLIESTMIDVRYALRALRRTPGFTAVVVLTLALGIGANTAIFSVVRGVLLKPLPHREGDRLVYLRQSTDASDGANVLFSVPEVRDFRSGAPSLGGIAEYSPFTFTLDADNEVARIDAGLVTGNFFEVLGLSPVLGRITRPSDDGPGVAPVMVLTYDYWMKRFGGDRGVIGRQLRVDGRSVTVIGVMQQAPFFPDRIDVLMNMVISPHHISAMMVEGRSHRMTEMIARLRPDATLQQVRNEVRAVHRRMVTEYAEAYDARAHYNVAVIPFKEVLGERARLTLWLLMGAAAFVMIISAANVTNLTLMRGVRREHELVVRAAMGAGVHRLRRLLLVENIVLALMGAAVGLLIALGGVHLLTALAERYSPRANEIELDGAVLGFTFALAMAVAFLLSFAAWLPKEGAFAAWISAGTRRISGSLRKQRLQRALVVAQIAVSVILLAGAGLLTRTIVRLSRVDTGLSSEEVLTMTAQLLNPSDMSLAADTRNRDLYLRMQREVRALPGVIEVGLGSTMPLKKSFVDFDIKTDAKTTTTDRVPHADFRTASPEYFRAAGIPLLKGREFTSFDRMGTDRVVIINKTLADRFFPGEEPIGRRIAFTGEVLKFTPISGEWRTIVGVVANTQDGGLDAEPRPAAFMPFAQEFAMLGGLVIRADSNAAALIPEARRIVQAIVPGTPIENVATITQIKEQSIAPKRLNAVLLSSFSILALIIAAVGIAGVLAFSVSARTGEIGIRMSLGADSGRVQRMVLGEGGELLVSGLVLGITCAYFGARVIQQLLFDVPPHDPVTFVAVAAVMAVIGLAACWFPARRASRINPAVTMRS